MTEARAGHEPEPRTLGTEGCRWQVKGREKELGGSGYKDRARKAAWLSGSHWVLYTHKIT